MTQNRFFSQEGDLVPGDLEAVEGSSSSCGSAFLAATAVAVPEDLSEQEIADLVEHAKTCSACGAILTQFQELQGILANITEYELPNEPEIQMSPKLQQALVQHESREKLRRLQSAQSSGELLVVTRMAARQKRRKNHRFQSNSKFQQPAIAWLAAIVRIAQVMEMVIQVLFNLPRKEDRHAPRKRGNIV